MGSGLGGMGGWGGMGLGGGFGYQQQMSMAPQRPEDIDVEDDYDGPRIGEDGLTPEFARELMEHLRDQKRLHKRYVVQVSARGEGVTG